jgi:hypothetical protein
MFNVQFTWQTPFILLVHPDFHDAPEGHEGREDMNEDNAMADMLRAG